MRICIPTEIDNGLKGNVFAHFGSTPYFVIYDTDKDSFEIISNGGKHHIHGMCNPLNTLESCDIDVVVCAGMGARAVQKLNEGGINAYRVIGGTVEETIKRYKEGMLEEITVENACINHNCH